MSGKIKIKWDDIEAKRAATEGVVLGVETAAHEILEASNQIVPFDEGVLESSGSVDAADGSANVFYETPYAVKLHEDRRITPQGGRSIQYLKKATMQSRSRVLVHFGDALKLKFSKGGKMPSA